MLTNCLHIFTKAPIKASCHLSSSCGISVCHLVKFNRNTIFKPVLLNSWSISPLQFFVFVSPVLRTKKMKIICFTWAMFRQVYKTNQIYQLKITCTLFLWICICLSNEITNLSYLLVVCEYHILYANNLCFKLVKQVISLLFYLLYL